MSSQLSLVFYYIIFLSTSLLAASIAYADYRDDKAYLFRFTQGFLQIRAGQLIKWFSLILIPVLTASFRYGLGTDYPSYKILYSRISQISNIDLATVAQPTEYISNLLYKIAYWMFNDFQGWLFLTSLITIAVAYLAIHDYRDTSDIFIMTFSYMALLFAPSLNIIRQIMAGSVVFWGLKYVPERKPIKYFVLIFIAMMLHTSAVFAALFYFLNVKESKYAGLKQAVMFALCATIPAVFSQAFEVFTSFSVFQSYGTIYSNQYGFLHVSDILFRLPIAALILVFRRRLEENDKDSRFYELLFFMEFVSLLLTGYNRWLYRMMYFCIPGEIVLVSRLPKCFSKNSKLFIRIGIVAYYVVFFYINNYWRGVDEIFPYITIFN